MYDLGKQYLVDVNRRFCNDIGCMYILVQTGTVESIVNYCSFFFFWSCFITSVTFAMPPWYSSQTNFPAGQTVNHVFSKYVLERLRRLVQRVRKDIADSWVPHDVNALANTALSISEFLEKWNIPTFPHPPYSPDLAPCDYFRTVENIRRILTYELRTLRTATSNGENVGTIA
jgi:transposase